MCSFDLALTSYQLGDSFNSATIFNNYSFRSADERLLESVTNKSIVVLYIFRNDDQVSNLHLRAESEFEE